MQQRYQKLLKFLLRPLQQGNQNPPSQKFLDAVQAYNILSEPEKEQFQLNNKLQDKSTPPPNNPSQEMVNLAWKWIIRAFVGVFFLAAAGIIFAVIVQFWVKLPPTLNTDPLITIFSTTVGYLAGVLTPKPDSSK